MLAMRTSALALAPLRPAHCVPSRERASTSVSVSVAKTPSRGARVTRGRTRLTRMRTTRVGAAGNDPPGPLDGLVAGVDAKKLRAAVASDSDADLVQVETVPPMQFLLSSTAFYVVMGVGSQVASGFLNIHPDVLDATRSLNLDQASLWMVPLLLSLAFAITHADKYEFLAEVRDIFKVGVLPSLAPLGLPGIVLLSLGAGVGEEAFFRGFLMPFTDGGLQSIGVPQNVSIIGVLTATSVFFGALHAITPAYFYWATGAGFLFGLEYVNDGLGTGTYCISPNPRLFAHTGLTILVYNHSDGHAHALRLSRVWVHSYFLGGRGRRGGGVESRRGTITVLER